MIKDLQEFQADRWEDFRGDIYTTWDSEKYPKLDWRLDKFSHSRKNTLRGVHGDFSTWKLISCVYGKFFIVVVDCEKKSNGYLTWKSWELSHKNGIQLLIPPNYANGHLCISDYCLFHYKLFYKGSYFGPKKQFSLKWNDPKLNIKWPVKRPILNSRDKKTKFL